MRYLPKLLLAALLCLLTSCLPAPTPPSPPPAPAEPVQEVSAGPYWHSPGPEVQQADALAYYAALKPLTADELNREHKRLIEETETTPENRLAQLQLVLIASLPGQTLVGAETAIKHLEAARQDVSLHRQLADLFILLADRLAAQQTVQSQNKQESQSLRSTRKKLTSQAEDLNTCRRERDDLSEKLQKLQNIERDLIDRERKK